MVGALWQGIGKKCDRDKNITNSPHNILMKLIKKLKTAVKINIVTTTGALAVLTTSPTAQAQQCAKTESFQVETALQKAFDNWATGILSIADDVPSTIPKFAGAENVIERSRTIGGAMKTTADKDIFINKLKQQEKIFEDIVRATHDTIRAERFNTRVQQLLSQNHKVAPEQMNLVDLQIVINNFVTCERDAEGLGTETLESHVALAARKFLLMKVKQNRLSWGTERHQVFEDFRNEIDYTKKHVENKFTVMKSRFERSISTKVGIVSYGEGVRNDYYGGVVYSGKNQQELLVQTWRSQSEAQKNADALRICKIDSMDRTTREKYKQSTRNAEYDKLKAAIGTEQRKMDISAGKWRLDGNRYYRFDLGNIPIGLDSMAITFNKTYRNCNIRLLNGNTTLVNINARNAVPNRPFLVSLRPNNLPGAAGRKVTRVEITPISNANDIKEIYVYGSNLALGALIQGIKDGKPYWMGVNYPERGTDGVKLDPNQEAYFQTSRYVQHSPNCGSRLDLRGTQTVGYIRIGGLLGASDGIRNMTVNYRDINGTIQTSQIVSRPVRYPYAGSAIITAPNTVPGFQGQHNIATIDITSPDPAFRYVEIEVYKPVDFPN